MMPDRWWSEIIKRTFLEGKSDGLVAWEDRCTAVAEAICFGVEWALKQTTAKEEWPLSWEAKFPGLKAQALLEWAAFDATTRQEGQ